MQRIILTNKNKIMWIQLVFIVIGLIAHHGFHQETIGVSAFLLAGVIGTLPLALQALSALEMRLISIDVLVTIAAIGALFIQNYEETAMVTFLFLFGSWLEAKTLDYTRSSIKQLLDLAPEKALLRQTDGQFVEVDVEEVSEGDLIQIRTGGKVPVDGKIMSGEGYLNEASITGESLAIRKKAGDTVYAGTLLDNGSLQIEATAVGEDTTFGRIIELVEEAQDSKSSAEKFIDQFSKYYTPSVLMIGLVVGLMTKDIETAITILVLGCPGALVIGVPVSNVAGIGNGAKMGVLLKGSEVIQEFSRVDTMIFDKTGTLTIGNPEVTEEIQYTGYNQNTVDFLATVERESDHPLARAVLRRLEPVTHPETGHTRVIKGGGIISQVLDHQVAVGNLALMEAENYLIPDQVRQDVERLAEQGHSIVVTAVDGQIQHLMGVRDQIRPGVKDQLRIMKALGVKNLVIASGDHQATVNSVAKELDLSQAIGHMLPADKSGYVKKLQSQGQIVAFVGDGVNDTPSLAQANIGIAMGSGTDVAIETSDVVLVNSDFEHLNHALGLTKAIYCNMRQNIYIAISVVFALVMMLFLSDYLPFGMNMALGMIIHEGSILAVILNAMRLLKYRLKN